MTKRWTRWGWTAAAMLAAAPVSLAQTASPAKDDPSAKDAPIRQAPRKIKSVRRAVVDLEAMAKERRPGQVMPGDPAPFNAPGAAVTSTPVLNPTEGGMEATSLPAPAMTGKPGSIQLPDTAPANRGIVKPAADQNGRTNSITPPPAPPTPPAAPVVETPTAATHVQASATRSAVHAEALPPMTEQKTEASAAKAEAADVAVALVDKSIIPNIPMALSTGPAKLTVESVSGEGSGVQWRVPGEAWRAPTASESVDSKMEVRAGLDSDLVIVVDERVQVRIPRLGRVLIERSQEAAGATAACITLSRGAVEVRPVKDAKFAPGEMFARVRTPDQMFGVTGALHIEYDAFTGTRRRTLNP